VLYRVVRSDGSGQPTGWRSDAARAQACDCVPVSQSDGLLHLLWGTLAWTGLWLFFYVSVRQRGVPLSPPPRLPPVTDPQDDGVRRVSRMTHEYNYSAARRDYLVRRYAPSWLILPGAVLSVLIGLADWLTVR
jgi:hypothetical protein